MESVLFNVLVGVACGLFIAWIFFKIRIGSLRQYSILLLRQAEDEACVAQHNKSMELMQLQCSVSQEKKDLELLRNQIEKESIRLQESTRRLHDESKALEVRQKDFSEKEARIVATLERVSNLSLAEAKSELIAKASLLARNEIERNTAKLARSIEEEQEAKAQKMLFCFLQRKTLGLTREQFLEEIPLPDASFIPRFIGKDGRNIKTLSQELDLNISIEETPPRLLISSYDPYRRALAKETILALISSEKITPYTISQTLVAQKESFQEKIVSDGVVACKTVGLTKALPPDVVKEIGAMRYRSTAGQNLLLHSIDVAELMATAAHELGLRSDKARLMGLLHDIGKTLPQTWGTSHALAGKNFLLHNSIDPEIVNAVAAHHGEEPLQTDEARLLPICDSLSARLFGTRNDQSTTFLETVRQCEHAACQHDGVVAAWAHHANSHIELVVHYTSGLDLTRLQNVLQSSFPSLPIRIRSIKVSKEPRDN